MDGPAGEEDAKRWCPLSERKAEREKLNREKKRNGKEEAGGGGRESSGVRGGL